jgi:hypothetical protein
MTRFFLFFLALPLLLGQPARLPAQSGDPILSLNTPMHIAKIRHIDTDRRGRYLLTCSLDKTARLWRLSDGQLLRTFRPPIGEGDEGKLYACALSPDGQVAAVGGWINLGKSGNHNIYLFDAHSGALLRRISGLPNVIFDLEFSPDGRYLGAALGGSHGIRVYCTGDYQLHAEDKDYGDRSNNLAFSSDGRLAGVSFDGYIRLYDAGFQLQQKVAATGGKQPYSLAFSPDGRLLALDYEDSPAIQVLDGHSLRLLYAPDVQGIYTKNRLNNVAFSTDGERLAAGYAYIIGSQYQIRIWEQGGRGAYKDYGAAANGIMDIKPLPGGAFAFGAAAPDWGVVQPQSGRGVYRAAELHAFNAADKSHFLLSAGGGTVGVTPFGKSPMQFSLPERRLAQTQSAHPAPVAERSGIRLSDWNGNHAPKLNGKALSLLNQYETCLSADIAVGGAAFVLGTGWYIRCAYPDGRQRWATSVPEAVWCVKIDEFGEVVAAALGDGTIRWYRMSDGALQLSLFLHPDGRWLLWTPSGYYDAAPGAEDLIGWHVNQGPDKEAAYYSVAQFRSTYYRPDIIDEVIESWDEKTAILRAGQMANRSTRTTPITAQLPPTVRLLSPADGAGVSRNTIEIEYSVNSPNDEPVTALRIQVDGRPIAVERGLKPIDRQRATVSIPSQDSRVSVIAENRFGASQPATVQLRWQGGGPTHNTIELRPKLYILAVGVSQYTHAKVDKLPLAAKDARDFAAVMQKQKGRLYADVQARILTDAQATKDNILDGLEWVQRQTTHRDVVAIFFAGHGVDDNAGTFYFLPVGADPAALKRSAVMKAEVQQTVATLAGKVLVFMDACHSGNLMKEISPTRRNLVPDINSVINELISAENGAVVFSSSTGRQYSLEDAAWGNGAFTKAIIEGMEGKAASGGRITVKTLDAYIAERVKALTKGQQTPTTNYPPNVPDFPVGLH